MTASRRVVVGYDGSPDADVALEWAAAWTRAHDAVLTIVRASEWPTFQGVPIVVGHIDPLHDMKQSIEAAADRTGLPADQVETLVAEGSPSTVLLDQAKRADLLVIGRRGLGGFSELLLGSVSHQCVTHARCPVAVIQN